MTPTFGVPVRSGIDELLCPTRAMGLPRAATVIRAESWNL